MASCVRGKCGRRRAFQWLTNTRLKEQEEVVAAAVGIGGEAGAIHHPERSAKRGPALLVDRRLEVPGDVGSRDRVAADLQSGRGREQ